jgi:excisionase family DNA binding protein
MQPSRRVRIAIQRTRILPLREPQPAQVMADAITHEPWRLLTITEAAERLSVGETMVRQLVADGELPYVRYQRAMRFRLEDLQAVAARRLVTERREDRVA